MPMPAQRTLLLMAGVSTLALLGNPAAAACTLANGDAGNMPSSGATVTCANNLDNTGITAPGANDVTVDVAGPGGGISVTGTNGILLGTGATVTVSGQSNRPVNTSGDTAAGIDVTSGATITVDGQVTTAGEASPAIRATDDATITIGTMGLAQTGGGQSPAVAVGANATVTIMGDGTMGGQATTGNSGSDAVVLGGMGSSLEVQSGARVTTSSGMSNPVQVDGANGTVTVAGDIRSSSGNASAILGTADGLTVTVRDGGFVTAQSSGSNAIEANGAMARVTVEQGGEIAISSGNSSAIVVGTGGMVQVDGTVKASSSQSQGIVLNDGAMLTVGPTGVIETSSSESQAVLVNESAMTATVTVDRGGNIDAVGAQALVDRGMTNTTVTVDGTVFGGSSDPVLDMGAGDDTVTVNGTVRGTSADPVILLGEGDDTLTDNSSTTVDGPGVLVDAGGGSDTLTLNNGKQNRSSQYAGFETTNVGRNGNPNDPANGMESSVTVDNDQSGNTVNANEGGSATVDQGGSVGNANARDGGSATVRNGGRADNVSSDGAGSSANVDNGGSAGRVSASNGGAANVGNGGRASSVSSDGAGSSASVDNGGSSDRVTASNGGATNVRSGGTANAGRADSSNGGRVTFESGSNANISRNDFGGGGQTVDFGDTQFDGGSTLTVADSPFLRASSTGRNVRFDYGANAFENAATDPNARSAGRALDETVAANPAFLDDRRAIATASTAEAPALLSDISGEVAAQAAAGGILAGQGFADGLRTGGGGAGLPLTAATAPAGEARVFGQSVVVPAPAAVIVRPVAPVLRPLAETRAWVAVQGGAFDIDGGPGADYDGTTLGGSLGIERGMALGPFRDATVGVGIGYSQTDIDGRFRDGEADAYHVGVYADGTLGGFETSAALSYTRADIEADGGADGDGDIVNARVEAAFDVVNPVDTGFSLGPVGRLDYTYADFDIDGAGPLNTGLDGDFSQVVAGIGLRAGVQGLAGSVHAEVVYEHAFGDETLDLTGSLPGGSSFPVTTGLLGEDRVRVGLGADLDVSDRLTLGLRLDGTFGDDGDAQGGMIRAAFRF